MIDVCQGLTPTFRSLWKSQSWIIEIHFGTEYFWLQSNVNNSWLKPEPPVVGIIMCYHCIRQLLVNLNNFWLFLTVFIVKFTFYHERYDSGSGSLKKGLKVWPWWKIDHQIDLDNLFEEKFSQVWTQENILNFRTLMSIQEKDIEFAEL